MRTTVCLTLLVFWPGWTSGKIVVFHLLLSLFIPGRCLFNSLFRWGEFFGCKGCLEFFCWHVGLGLYSLIFSPTTPTHREGHLCSTLHPSRTRVFIGKFCSLCSEGTYKRSVQGWALFLYKYSWRKISYFVEVSFEERERERESEWHLN